MRRKEGGKLRLPGEGVLRRLWGDQVGLESQGGRRGLLAELVYWGGCWCRGRKETCDPRALGWGAFRRRWVSWGELGWRRRSYERWGETQHLSYGDPLRSLSEGCAASSR